MQQDEDYELRPQIHLNEIETWHDYLNLLRTTKHFSPQMYQSLQTLDQETKANLENKILTAPFNFNMELDPLLGRKVSLFAGDITVVELDVIINATNPTLSAYGMGVNGAVYFHSRDPLQMQLDARRALYDKLMKEKAIDPDVTFEQTVDYQGLIMEVGEAVLTQGFKLPSKYVIHTFGPGTDKEVLHRDEDLVRTYRNCLQIVEENGFKTIGFCCVSAGKFGFPVVSASDIALRTVREWLEKDSNYEKIDRIVFFVKNTEDQQVYEQLMELYFPCA
jgi:O-acetyl-ADP-ribose deacetylase (regulator of RNase III)